MFPATAPCSSALKECCSPTTASTGCSRPRSSPASSLPEPTIPRSIGHHAEWIKACKEGTPTTCNFDYSGALTEAVLLGNVAYRVGQPLEWDAKAAAGDKLPRGLQVHLKKVPPRVGSCPTGSEATFAHEQPGSESTVAPGATDLRYRSAGFRCRATSLEAARRLLPSQLSA